MERKGIITGDTYENSIRVYNFYADKMKRDSETASLLLKKYHIEENDPKFPFNLIEIKNPHHVFLPKTIKPDLVSKDKEFNLERRIAYEKIFEDKLNKRVRREVIGRYKRSKNMRENLRRDNAMKVKKIVKAKEKEFKEKLNLPLKEKMKRFIRIYKDRINRNKSNLEEEKELNNPQSEEIDEISLGKQKFLWMMASDFYFGEKFKNLQEENNNEKSEKFDKKLVSKKEKKPDEKTLKKKLQLEKKGPKSLSKLESIYTKSLSGGSRNLEENRLNTFEFEFTVNSTPERTYKTVKELSKKTVEYEYSNEDGEEESLNSLDKKSIKSSIIKIEYGNQ